MNIQGQIESAKSKAESDKQLENDKAKNKEKEIVLQGAIELAKAGVQMPSELKSVLMQVIENAAKSLYVESVEKDAELMQVAQAEQEMMMQQQEQQVA